MAMVEDYIIMVIVMMKGEGRANLDKIMAKMGRVGETPAVMVLVN